MTDSADTSALRVRKTDATATAKRIRGLLDKEFGQQVSHQQALVFTAKAFGWRNQETMVANYLDTPDSQVTTANQSAHAAIKPQSMMDRAAWRLIDLCETIDRDKSFRKVAGKYHNERQISADILQDEVQEWLRDDATFQLSLDSLSIDKTKESFARSRAAASLSLKAQQLAESLWLFRPGYQNAFSDVDFEIRDVMRYWENSSDKADRKERNYVGELFIRAASHLLVLTAIDTHQSRVTKSRFLLDIPSLNEVADLAADRLGKYLDMSSPAMEFIQSEFPDRSEFTVPFSGREAAEAILTAANDKTKLLWWDRQHYLNYLSDTALWRQEVRFIKETITKRMTVEPKAHDEPLSEQFDILRVEVAADLFHAGLDVLPNGNFTDAMHTDNARGLHPLLSVEEQLAKTLETRPDLIDYIKTHSIEWAGPERTDDPHRAAMAMVNEAMPFAERLWTVRQAPYN